MKAMRIILVKAGTFRIGNSNTYCCIAVPFGDA